MKLFLIILFSGLTQLQAQQVLYNVNYTNEQDALHQLDLYLPAKNEKFPVIIFLHEGGLSGGDKRENNLPAIAQKFQADGIAVALVNYRLAPTLWPAQPDDACQAFAWIKKNIEQYGGDATKLFLAGHSSGALLTALIATDEKYLAKQNLSLQNIKGAIVIGSQLKAVLPAVPEEKISTYFQSDGYLRIFQNRQTYEDASPMMHINKNIPPMRFIIAEAEQTNPPILEQTKDFISKASAFNADLKYHVIPDRRHLTNVTKMIEPGDIVYGIIKEFVLSH